MVDFAKFYHQISFYFWGWAWITPVSTCLQHTVTLQSRILIGRVFYSTFTGERRERYNVPNITLSLITFDPASRGLETIEWPSVIPENAFPYGGPVVNVPELQMTYFAGPQMSSLGGNTFPTELYAYNYSDGSITRKKAPSKFWSTASFLHLGKKGILVMLGGLDIETASPVSF